MNFTISQKTVFSVVFFFFLSVTLIFSSSVTTHASIDLEAESAIIVDADTGEILYAKEPDIALPPASMTKMMTEYLVWEAIEKGVITWDTETEISDYPYGISANPSFSGIGLRQNVNYTVQSLYEAMAINSDNGTTIALAELVGGKLGNEASEGEFVKLMNQKAEELGLPDYNFVNSTGLENKSLGDNFPEGTDSNGVNLLSARSSALLAYHLVNDFPEILTISSLPQVEFDGRTIINWNRMLPHEGQNFQQWFYEGVDGLKTGYTELAEYCFTGTAEVDGRRLITVVMKTSSEDQRFQETAKLLDYGYENFGREELFPEGYQLEDESILPVEKGKEKEVEIALADAIQKTIHSDDLDKYSIEYELDEDLLNDDGKLTAPIEEGEKVGTVKLIYDGTDYGYIDDQLEETIDLITTSSVERNNWFMITVQSIGDFFGDFFSNAVDTVKGWF